MKSIEEQLIKHEGFEPKVYHCPASRLTIGVGRNLEDKGITREEALYLLRNDIKDMRNYATPHCQDNKQGFLRCDFELKIILKIKKNKICSCLSQKCS